MAPQDKKLNKAIQNYWSLRAQGYSLSTGEELSDTENIYRTILKNWLPGRHNGQCALDIGCGPGFLAIELAKLGFTATGVDSCEAMIDQAQRNTRAWNIRLILNDAAENLFSDNTFDVIASRNLVWNLPDPEKAYHQWFKWLKPHGKLIIFDGNHYRYLTDSERNDRPHRETHKHLGNVDISIMESIAKELPMSRYDRPEYDQQLLKAIGFVNIDTIVLRQTGKCIHDFAIMCEKDHAD